MKIKSVGFNNRKKGFEVKTRKDSYWFPYAKTEILREPDDRVSDARVDPELGREGFTYTLGSGREGTIHMEQVLEYNQDPSHMRDALLYKLTIEAQKRLNKSPLSRREIIRRLNTSAAQLYRLLDQTNYRKSIDQMLALLNILDCEVDLVVREDLTATRSASLPYVRRSPTVVKNVKT